MYSSYDLILQREYQEFQKEVRSQSYVADFERYSGLLAKQQS